MLCKLQEAGRDEMQIAGAAALRRRKKNKKCLQNGINSADAGLGTISAKNKSMIMVPMLAVVPIFAAIGYSIIYLLLGGGLGGAVIIFILAKMLGK
jgi:hypothetical protein